MDEPKKGFFKIIPQSAQNMARLHVLSMRSRGPKAVGCTAAMRAGFPLNADKNGMLIDMRTN